MSVNFTNLISGYILVILMNCTYIFYFLDFLFKQKKIKKISSEVIYLNKKIKNVLFLFFLFIIPIFFFVTTILFVTSIIYNSLIIYLGFIFTCFYLLDSILILILIIELGIYQRSIFLIKYEEKIVLIDEIIQINKIKSISNDIKRKFIFISYFNDKNEEEFLKLKYHWELKEWLNNFIKL